MSKTVAAVKNTMFAQEPQSRALIQAIELEETEPSSLMTALVFVIGGLVFWGLVWAGITRVDEVARAEGKIIPESDVQAIQHLEGGIVSEILVKAGEFVKQGQPLIRMAPTNARAQLDQMMARRMSVLLERERQKALAEEREPDFSAISGVSAVFLKDQMDVFRTQRDAYVRQRDILENQLQQQQAEHRRLTNQLPGLKEEAQLLHAELKRIQGLLAKGLATQRVLLDVRRQSGQADLAVREVEDRLAATAAAIEEAKQRVHELDSRTKAQALTRVGELDLELAEIEESIKTLRDRTRRLELVAPVNGIVQHLAVNAVNAVVQPAETLLEIVPVDERLLVEVRIDPKDIGQIRPGQEVDLKVSTFDYTLYGSIPGTLLRVSATTFQTPKGAQYYRAMVAPERTYVGNDPEKNKLLPGMVVQASIKVGQKSILDYLLKPVYRGFSEAFRER